MTRLICAFALFGLVGCGGSPKPNTAKMTDEEVRKMREEDNKNDDEERSGSGTAVQRKRR